MSTGYVKVPNYSSGGGVESVTGAAVDNTDPANPVINSTATLIYVFTSDGSGNHTSANFSGKTLGTDLFISLYVDASTVNTELGTTACSLAGTTLSGLAATTKYKAEIY